MKVLCRAAKSRTSPMTTELNSASLELPDVVFLNIPKDYAHYCRGNPVRILEEISDSDLTVRWNETEIQFLGKEGGASFQRAAILNFRIERQRKLMKWRACALGVKLRDVYLPILSSETKYAAQFDAVVRELVAANVPLDVS